MTEEVIRIGSRYEASSSRWGRNSSDVFVGDNLQYANSREPVAEQSGQGEERGKHTSQSGVCRAGCRRKAEETVARRFGSCGERRKEETETQPVR